MMPGRALPHPNPTDSDPMHSPWLYPVCPFAALAVFVLVQGLLLRLAPRKAFYRSVVAGFLAGSLALVAAQAWVAHVLPGIPHRTTLLVVANPAMYLGLSYGFFNFINLGHSSIRIRVFGECERRGGFISREVLAMVYDEEAIRHGRLARLLDSGHIALDKGRWRLASSRLVPVALVVFLLKRLVLGRSSQFDEP